MKKQNNSKHFNLHVMCMLLLTAVSLLLPIKVQAARILGIGAGDYILPDSSTEYYTNAEISDMTAQQLCYARNEIFAKHGRKFTSAELQEYFGTKSWYHPVYSADEFSDDVFSDAENANVRLLWNREYAITPDGYTLDEPGYRSTWGSLEVQSPDEGAFSVLTSSGSSAEIDLEQDGISETVYLEPMGTTSYDPYSEYRLHVGDAWIDGKGISVVDKVYTISLDGKETLLVIYEDGPSDDPLCTFYRYEDDDLYRIGEIDDSIRRITVDKGILNCITRCRILQTDEIHTYWTVSANGMIEQVPQDYYTFDSYTRGNTYQLRQAVTVYEEPSFSAGSYTLSPQTITIPYTDAVSWVYFQTADGDGGWVERQSLPGKTGELMKMIDGLLFAD